MSILLPHLILDHCVTGVVIAECGPLFRCFHFVGVYRFFNFVRIIQIWKLMSQTSAYTHHLHLQHNFASVAPLSCSFYDLNYLNSSQVENPNFSHTLPLNHYIDIVLLNPWCFLLFFEFNFIEVFNLIFNNLKIKK